jgi:hypothetical protein
MNVSTITSCSSTPKSRVAIAETAASPCPSPGSEKSATPSGASTRAISPTARAMFGT